MRARMGVEDWVRGWDLRALGDIDTRERAARLRDCIRYSIGSDAKPEIKEMEQQLTTTQRREGRGIAYAHAGICNRTGESNGMRAQRCVIWTLR